MQGNLHFQFTKNKTFLRRGVLSRCNCYRIPQTSHESTWPANLGYRCFCPPPTPVKRSQYNTLKCCMYISTSICLVSILHIIIVCSYCSKGLAKYSYIIMHGVHIFIVYPKGLSSLFQFLRSGSCVLCGVFLVATGLPCRNNERFPV